MYRWVEEVGSAVTTRHSLLPWPERYVLTNLYRLGDQAPGSIGVAGGEIAFVSSESALASWPRLEMGGRVVIPGLVDPHQHLDKTHLFPALRNDSGTLQEAIATVRQHYAACTVEEILARASAGIELAIAAGTTALRSHADTGDAAGLKGVEALLRLRAEYGARVRLQVVAMARVMPDGTFDDAALAQAARLGVDAVGGAPWLAAPPARRTCIDNLFRIAAGAGLPLDLHVDESDDAADLTLPHIARRARETDFRGRVVAGHCCSLAALPDADASGVIAAVAESGVHIVTLPAVNLYLQGRADRQPVRRGVTRVRELLAAGVNVAAGSDNVRDPFYPFGDGDLLRLAALTCSVVHLPGLTGMATALAMVTDASARAIGLAPKYGLCPGAWADLVVLDLPGPAGPEHVLSRQPGRYLILCGGVPSVAPPALRFASQGAPE